MGMVGFEALVEADAIELRALIDEHGAAHRLAGRRARARATATSCSRAGAFVKVMPHDYKRVLRELAEQRPRGAATAATAAPTPLTRSRAALMGELGGFLKIERHGVPHRDPAERAHDYREFLLTRPVAELREQGARCMECGVPFCHNGCPLGNLIPDWNDLVYRDRWQDAIAPAARDQQLPRVHRPPVPGAVRGRLRARDPRGRRGHDQADRELDHQPRLGRGLGQAAAAAPRDRPARSPSSAPGPAGHGRRAAAAPRRPRA